MNKDWQPIETAPKDGKMVLIGREDGLIHVSRWVDAEWRIGATINLNGVEIARMQIRAEPTHWMPLPPPPEHTP